MSILSSFRNYNKRPVMCRMLACTDKIFLRSRCCCCLFYDFFHYLFKWMINDKKNVKKTKKKWNKQFWRCKKHSNWHHSLYSRVQWVVYSKNTNLPALIRSFLFIFLCFIVIVIVFVFVFRNKRSVSLKRRTFLFGLLIYTTEEWIVTA